ncbi:hypothetical protein TVAG_198020 [Trichomonas vaginalis G3]|uniref:Uncharacterized protein n=1 Tax=Trichomonas vaginalis (strain ATCC PRA-98 / G3) TaxID=412133 RepID=A2EJL8_TRIV3|nr:nuclear chaperone required for maturation and nuclear export of pre-60s ribosome subunits [Trichomonas vaginalis G3]EAY07188.1 hypothetical protein TVAG_198020 [Trichomonas vaginalis G3]KAI5503628.1 nuclear chaperone required for maturation and nuclear export of pre-60s ribosome subunits [Trichomonas vaginalis G3]|eukprot:XP_001319411.1 hypothetical protein [Trichomonas vaginalis G3]
MGQNEKYQPQRPQIGGIETTKSIIKDLVTYCRTNMILFQILLKKIISLKTYQISDFEECFADLAEKPVSEITNIYSIHNVILSVLSLAESNNYKNVTKCFLYLSMNTELFANFKYYYFDIYSIQKLANCQTIGKFLKWSLRIASNPYSVIKSPSFYYVIFDLAVKIPSLLGCKAIVESKDPKRQDFSNLLFTVIKGKLIRVQYQKNILESGDINTEINDKKLYDFLTTIPALAATKKGFIPYVKFEPNERTLSITENCNTVMGLSMFCDLPPPSPYFSKLSHKIYEISRHEVIVNCDQIDKWYIFVDYLYKDMEKYQTKDLNELISKTEDKLALEKYLLMDFTERSPIASDFIQFQEKIKQELSNIPQYNYRKLIAIINDKQHNYEVIQRYQQNGLINENVDDKLLKQFTDIRDQSVNYHPQVDIKGLYKYDENDKSPLSGINWIEPIVKYSFVCRLISDLKDYPVLAFDQLIVIDRKYLEFADAILLKGDQTKIGELEDYATMKVYEEYQEKPELLVDKLWLGNFDKLRSNFKSVPDSWYKYACYLMDNYAMDSDLIFPPKNVNLFHKIAQKGFKALQSIEKFESIDLSKVYNFKQYFEIISPLVKDQESSSFKRFKLVCETIETPVKMDEPLPDVWSYLHRQFDFYPIGKWLRNHFFSYENIINTHLFEDKITLAVIIFRIISNPKALPRDPSINRQFDALIPKCKEFNESILKYEGKDQDNKMTFTLELSYFALMSILGSEPRNNYDLPHYVSEAFKYLTKRIDLNPCLEFFDWVSIVYMYSYQLQTSDLSKIAKQITLASDIDTLLRFNFTIFRDDWEIQEFFTKFQNELKRKVEDLKKQKKKFIDEISQLYKSAEWDATIKWFNEIHNYETSYEFYKVILENSKSVLSFPLKEQFSDICKNVVQQNPNEYNYLLILSKYSYFCYLIEKAKSMHLSALYLLFKDRTDSNYSKKEVLKIMLSIYNKDYKALDEIQNEYKLYYYTQLKNQPNLLFKQNVVKKLNEFGNEFNDLNTCVYDIIGKIWTAIPIDIVLQIPEDIDVFIQNAKLSPEKVSKLIRVNINDYKPKQQENVEIETPNEYNYFKEPVDYNHYALSHLFLQRLKQPTREEFYSILAKPQLSVAHIIIRAFSTINVLNNTNLKKSISTKFMDIINSRISTVSDDYQREFLSIFIYILYDHKPPKPSAIQNECLTLTELATKKDEMFLDNWIKYMTKLYNFIVIAKNSSFDAIAKEVKEWSDYEMFMNFDFKKEFDGYDCNVMTQFQQALKSDMTTRPSYYMSLFDSIISSKKNNYEIIKYFIDNGFVNINQTPPYILTKLVNLSEIQQEKVTNSYTEEFKKVKLNEINNAEFDIGWLEPLVKFSHDLSLIEKCRNYDFFAIYEMIKIYPDAFQNISEFLSKDKCQFLDDLEKQTYDELFKVYEAYPDLFNPRHLLTKLNMTAMTYKSLKSESISQLFDLINTYDLNEEIVLPKQTFSLFFDHCTKLFPFLSNVNGFRKYKPSKFTSFNGFVKDVKKMIGKKPLPEFDQLRKFCDQIETFNDEKIIYFDDIKELKNKEYKKVPVHYLLMKKYPSLSYFVESLNMEKLTVGLIVFRLFSSMNIFDSLQESEILNGQISEVNLFDEAYISNLNEKNKINLIEYYSEKCKDLFIQILKENNFENYQINQITVDKNIDNIIKTALEAREIFSKMHLQRQKTISNSNKYFLMNYSDYKNKNLINVSLLQIKDWSEKENYSKYLPRYFSEVLKTYNIDKNEIADNTFVANPMLHFFNKLKGYLGEEETSENSPLVELQSKIDDLQNKVMQVKSDIENDIKHEIKEIKDKTIRSKWVEYSGHVSRILKTVPQVMMKPSAEIDSIKLDKLEFFEMVKNASDNYGDYNEFELLYHSKGILKVVNNKTGKYFKYPIQNNPYLMWFTPGLDRSMYVFENCSPKFVKIRLAKIVKEPAKTDMKTFTKIYNELMDLVKQTKEENIFIGKYNLNKILALFNVKTFSPEDFCQKMKEIDPENVTFGKVKSNVKKLLELSSQMENLNKDKEKINSRSRVIDENLQNLQNIEIPKIPTPKTYDNLHFNVQTKFIPKVILDQEKVLPNFNFIYISCQNVNKTAKNLILQIKVIGVFQFLYLNVKCQNQNDQNLINTTIKDDFILFIINLEQINTDSKPINGVFTVADKEIPFTVNLKLIVNGHADDIDFVFQKFTLPQMKFDEVNLPVFDGSDMSNGCQSMSDCLSYCDQFLPLVFMMKVKNINDFPPNAMKLYKLFSDLNEWISSRKISTFAPYGETAKSFLVSFAKLRSSLGISEKSVEDYLFSLEKVVLFADDISKIDTKQSAAEEQPVTTEEVKEEPKEEEKVVEIQEIVEEKKEFEFKPIEKIEEPQQLQIPPQINQQQQTHSKKKQKKHIFNQFQMPPQFQDYKPQQTQQLQMPPQQTQQLQMPPQLNQQLQMPPQISQIPPQTQTLQMPPHISQQTPPQTQTLQMPPRLSQQVPPPQQQTLQMPPQFQQMNTGFGQIPPQQTQQFVGFGQQHPPQQQEMIGFGQQQQFGFGQQQPQQQFGFAPQFGQQQFGYGMQSPFTGFGTAPPQMQHVFVGQNQPPMQQQFTYGFAQNNEPEQQENEQQQQSNRQRKRRRN